MLLFNTLAPMFVFLDDATLQGINRLTYWVALPALLITVRRMRITIAAGCG